MKINIAQMKHHLEEYKELSEKLKKLQLEYVFLLDIKNIDECKMQIENYDIQLTSLKSKMEKINENDSNVLIEAKKHYEKLSKKIDVLYEFLNIQIRIRELEHIIVNNVLKENEKENESRDIRETLLQEIRETKDFKSLIDSFCISVYKVPLLVALITRDPSEIEEDIQVSNYPQELKDNIIIYIEQKKKEIERNLILTDKALIDLIENTTGQNITNQQRHNERRGTSTGFNKQFNGQVLLELGKGYTLLKNQTEWRRATFGRPIKRFYDKRSNNAFSREERDMLSRDYPDIETEDIVSFESISNEKKRNLIKAVISNLELCYEMFESYYHSDKIEIPIVISLTNDKKEIYKFEQQQLFHLLGIPRIHNDKGDFNLPQATIKLLDLETLKSNRTEALQLLESILEHKDKIIDQCGLNYDEQTHSYYEMLPWEKIILKTNAFIRGDFFKNTSLITPINPNSFLIDEKDGIKRISITPTSFSKSAINQPQLDSDVEVLKKLERNNSSDFTIKGMMYKNGIWIPKTNVSAIGERITPDNADTLQTLEKYRYLLPDSGDEGGIIKSVKSSKDDGLVKNYSVVEILTALIQIANSLGTTKNVNVLKGYVDQVQQTYRASSTYTDTPKRTL